MGTTSTPLSDRAARDQRQVKLRHRHIELEAGQYRKHAALAEIQLLALPVQQIHDAPMPCSTPFGLPVKQEVKMTSTTSSGVAPPAGFSLLCRSSSALSRSRLTTSPCYSGSVDNRCS